jgi:hypothetical protein
VELVLGQQTLDGPGGSETYLLTVAEQLQRLGHEVTIFVVDAGDMTRVASERGLRVALSEHELPRSCGGVLAQDAVVAPLLAARYPGVVQLYVAHGPGVDVARPPQLDGMISAVVALNDRVIGRLDGLARRHEVVRLRQPIDIHRFTPRGDSRAVAESAVLVSNYLDGAERAALTDTCADVAVRLEHIGVRGRRSMVPEVDMAAVDIIFGHGRAALEGMACGRAVYVVHRWGRDGWVTPDSYGAFEADGFAGQAGEVVIDDAQLRRDLAEYRPAMGRDNRRLVVRGHHALDHARELVVLLRRLSPSPRASRVEPAREMARLVRLQWQTEQRCHVFATETAALRAETAALRLESTALREQLERERRDFAALRGELEAVRRTRRYRVAQLLARPLDVLRRRRR